MRIGIDTRWIFQKVSGIGTYTFELVSHLAALDQENDYILFFNNKSVMERVMSFVDNPRFTPHLIDCTPYSLKSQLLLPILLCRLGLDIFHSPNFMLPLMPSFCRGRRGVRYVTTIHDLIPLIFPHYTPKAKKTKFLPLFRWLMYAAARKADRIIAPSRATQQDVNKYLRIATTDQRKVVVIPEGVSSVFQQVERTAVTEQKTILYVGRLDPYKNVPLLVEAFGLLRKRQKQVRLQIVGPEDVRYPEARDLAKRLDLEPWINWQGYLEDGALQKVYQQADLFVLPSRYEGFGLTVLEAMASGVPVVCTKTSSLTEVAGEAALMIDPDDVVGLAEAMEKVLINAPLAEAMIEKGLQQAHKFTWAKAAANTLDLYKTIFVGKDR